MIRATIAIVVLALVSIGFNIKQYNKNGKLENMITELKNDIEQIKNDKINLINAYNQELSLIKNNNRKRKNTLNDIGKIYDDTLNKPIDDRVIDRLHEHFKK